jgi:periplasmic protein CpxP/Spy
MKQFILAILFLGFVFAVNAQQPGGQKKNQPQGKAKGHDKTPEERAKKFTARLDSALVLSPEQEQKVTALVTARAQEIKTVREKYKSASGNQGDNMKKAQEEIKPIRKKFNDDLKAILTPEQKTKYDALVKQRKEQKKAKKTAPEPEEELED